MPGSVEECRACHGVYLREAYEGRRSVNTPPKTENFFGFFLRLSSSVGRSRSRARERPGTAKDPRQRERTTDERNDSRELGGFSRAEENADEQQRPKEGGR